MRLMLFRHCGLDFFLKEQILERGVEKRLGG
jgi:hypothetical protein